MIHHLGQPLHQFGMLVGHIVLFGFVLAQIKKLDGIGLLLAIIELDGFPVALADGSFPAHLMELPIKVLVGFLFASARQGWSHGDAVKVFGWLDACHIGGGG